MKLYSFCFPDFMYFLCCIFICVFRSVAGKFNLTGWVMVCQVFRKYLFLLLLYLQRFYIKRYNNTLCLVLLHNIDLIFIYYWSKRFGQFADVFEKALFVISL